MIPSWGPPWRMRTRAGFVRCVSAGEPAAPMYVARVAGQFITKRMPGTGVQHDPGCESYEAPPELSGFGDVVGRAIQEDADAGVTVLRLGFSLSRTGRRPASAGGSA